MSAAINTGGPVFPMQDQQAIHAWAAAQISHLTDTAERDRAYLKARAQAIGGMTLRDYFAAKAMAVVWTEIPDDADRDRALRRLGNYAYEMADAMLTARTGDGHE